MITCCHDAVYKITLKVIKRTLSNFNQVWPYDLRHVSYQPDKKIYYLLIKILIIWYNNISQFNLVVEKRSEKRKG